MGEGDEGGIEEKVKFVYDIRLLKVLKTLKLEKEDLVHFWNLFKKYDLNNNDLLDFNEFLPLVDKDSTIQKDYTENLFKLVGIEDSTELSFSEFVHAIVTYCLFGPEDILKFCFYVFDKNRDGCIDHEELHALTKMLYSDAKKGNVEQVLKTFNQCKQGIITFEEFRSINKKHPLLLYPAFRLQLKLRQTICGNEWWHKRMRKIMKERRLSQEEHEKVMADVRDANMRERKDFLRRLSDNAPSSFRDIYSKWSANSSFRRSNKVARKRSLTFLMTVAFRQVQKGAEGKRERIMLFLEESASCASGLVKCEVSSLLQVQPSAVNKLYRTLSVDARRHLVSIL